MKPLSFFTLALVSLVPALVSRAEHPKFQTFDSAGVPIRYTVEGEGDPVVLIHGLTASADLNWRLPGVIKTLAPHFRVIAFDARGHGGSGKPKAESAYGVEMEEDVVRLLDHLHIQKAHIVGYSMGGMITMKLLTRHPERVRSALLGGMGWMRESSHLQEFWSGLPPQQRGSTPAACVRSLGELAVTEAEIKAIRVPVTIVVGEKDPCRALYVEPLQRIRPDWPVQLVPGANHFACIFKSDFNEDIRDWLGRQ